MAPAGYKSVSRDRKGRPDLRGGFPFSRSGVDIHAAGHYKAYNVQKTSRPQSLGAVLCLLVMLCAFLGGAARSFIALQGQKRPAGAISGQRHRLPTRCGGLRGAGAKATRRDALRPDAPSTDRLRRPAPGRGKSHLPGCAPVRRAVCRRAAPLCDGQGQKPPAGVCSGQPCRLPTGCASHDGQGQKPPAGAVSGQLLRLATGCGGLRWAGAKATGWDDLRPVATSTDRLCLSATGKGKSHLPGLFPASCSVWRPAAPLYDGQGQKPPAGVISGQLCRLPTGCASLRWAGAKATGWDDLRPVAASTDRLRRPTMGRGKSHGAGSFPASGSIYRRAAPLCDGQGQKRPAGVCSPFSVKFAELEKSTPAIKRARSRARVWGRGSVNCPARA